MNGIKLFVDTNIVLYLLSGDTTIEELLQNKSVYISFITQLELLGYKNISNDEEKLIEQFIDNCTIVDINNQIKQVVIDIRKNYKVKLPDSIIMASSIHLEIPLLSGDSYFNKVSELDFLYFKKK